MGRIRAIVVLILALGLGAPACSTFTVQHPVGQPVSDEVGKKVEGVWRRADTEGREVDYYYLKYLPNGEIRVACVEWKESEKKFQLSELHGLLTSYEGALYLHLLEPQGEQDTAPEYHWFLVEPQGNRSIVLWVPRPDTFGEAVERGELAGQIRRGGPGMIAATKPELEEFLKDHKTADLFVLEKPLVLIRP